MPHIEVFDSQENFGTLESTEAVYEQMIHAKVATPKIILNYARLLEEHKFYEKSFQAYEKVDDC